MVAFWAFGAAAVAAAPGSGPVTEPLALPPPPGVLVMKAASLGRSAAAADLSWLRAIQFIGAPHSQRVQYRGLADWIELTNRLDPAFAVPYYHGSILLATEPGQEIAAGDILSRAERNLVPASCRDESACVSIDRSSRDAMFATCIPCSALVQQGCSWDLPLAHAFVEFFGRLDPAAAAEHYCTASRRGGPPVTRHRAASLLEQSTSCRELRNELISLMRSGETGGGASMLSQNRLRIAVHCEENTINHALAAHRVQREGDAPTIQALLDAGLLKAAPWVPNPSQCWSIERGDAVLGSCP